MKIFAARDGYWIQATALDIFIWLEIIDTSDRQEFLSRQRHEGTVNWVFEEESCKVYHEWASATESGFLWLQGKAGAGKSVIAAVVVEELSKRPPEEEFLAHFFCDFRDVRTLRTPTILKALFAQFVQIPERELADLFPDLIERHAGGLPPPSEIEDLLDLLLRAMRLHKRKVIVIDGLNECNDIPTVLGCLEKISAEEDVRLLVASRPEQIFLNHLAGRPTMALEDYIEFANEDMRNSLLKQMKDHFRLQAIPSGTKTEVQDSMVKQADGSFWYAQCQLDSLHACRSVGGVCAIIENLPLDLDRTYDNILFGVNEMSKNVRTIVQLTLRWLGGALRPLTISQVIEATQIEIDKSVLNHNLTVVSEEDLLFLCGDLIRLDDQTTGIGLAHRTVLEYLTKPPSYESISRYCFDAHEVHRDLALRSISYILTEDIVRGIEQCNKSSYLFESSKRHFFIDHCPMIPYVFDGGFEHLQHITKEDDEVINSLIKLQIQVKEQRDKYALIIESLHDRVEGNPYEWILDEAELVLGILIRFGPPWMLKRFLLRHRPDLARGEEIDKLLARVEILGRSAELEEILTDRKIYEFVGQ
ncbi:hypothetical protein F5I97DRAFT_161722 [Phlebopus sp. FC_14]|nr:hypothetical protein F5I97DRAFT_161722 [Phlebopus sp. FC_14]